MRLNEVFGSTSVPYRVILNHDAAIDEYMSTVLLTTMDNVELLGIVIINADCIAEPAMQAAWKIQQYIDRTDIPISLSRARGWNPFPWAYRGDCIKENDLALLQNLDPKNPAWPPFPDGDAAMAKILRDATGPVVLLVTGPLTTLRHVLEKEPALAQNVAGLLWMGGAVDVPGNLDPTTLPPSVANPYAEWNAFWDPHAVNWIFENTEFPIVMFPLDITNKAALRPDFMHQLFLQSKRYRYSTLAYASYQLVAAESFYEMWDVVTTSALAIPDIFQVREKNLTIATEGALEGAIIETDDGRPVTVATDFVEGGQDAFYAYVLEQFRR